MPTGSVEQPPEPLLPWLLDSDPSIRWQVMRDLTDMPADIVSAERSRVACRVDVNVRATAERIWALLTDATAFPRWNSTVTRIEGEIRAGARLRVHAPGTDRVFTPTVSGVVPNKRMTWTGGVSPIFKDVRTFELRPNGDGSTEFTMAERFSGLLVPLVRRSLPEFGPIFARYASHLQRDAEEGDAV